jgi:hypothetical protein
MRLILGGSINYQLIETFIDMKIVEENGGKPFAQSGEPVKNVIEG